MTQHANTPFVLGDHAHPAPARGPGPGTRTPAGALDHNLAALSKASPELALRLRQIEPHPSVEFTQAPDGALSGVVEGRALASKRRPLEEADRLIDTVDVREAAIIAVMGFGMGYHLERLAAKLGRTGVILCYEPDLALLRSVLERVDHSEWISKTNFAFVASPDDAATVSTILQGVEGLVAMGVRLVEHPPSSARLGETSAKFGQTLTDVVSAIRTNVVTTLVQTETTVRNLLMNADRYVGSPGIADLRNLYENRPAVVVAAGPSLERNMRLLAAPGVRDRCCIVAVQTVLKPLLRAGIRPHFVVALDHHEISRRFYEGLTAEDVAGVTLVVEPKANPAILDAWPGEVRMPTDTFLDAVLGADLADKNRGHIRAGATVAHLAHYLARHMGCDPVALVGQDLGFTDHQYYAAGAAIHEVWAGDLNEFVSLELLEWQRIARSKGILRKAKDQQGRDIYTDDQMATYLAQFERDFLADVQNGLMVVDATEGGVRKANTSPMPLAEFLRIYARDRAPALPSASPSRPGSRVNLAAALERLRDVRQGVWNVARLCRQTETILAQMSEHLQDQARVNRLIAQTEQIAKDIAKIQPAYALAQRYNQMGVFNRSRDDRAIMLEDLSPLDRQRRQIERDQRNVRWLAEATDRLGSTLDAACKALRGGEKITRDLSAPSDSHRAARSAANARASGVGAILFADTRRGVFGLDRDLVSPIGDDNALRMTVRRLARCERLEGLAILTDNPDSVRAALKGVNAPYTIAIERIDTDDSDAGRRAILAGRLWARDCWRAGLAGLSVFDELADPALAARTLDSLGLRAALLVGADWPFVDPDLCDALIARHEESPESHRLVFTQSSPGLCGCVIDAALLREIGEKRTPGAIHASIGSLLAYNPRKPRPDPIAKPICVGVPTRVRDAQTRFIADDAAGVSRAGAISRALSARGVDPRHADAAQVVDAWNEVASSAASAHTLTLLVDEGTSADSIAREVRALGSGNTALGVTLDARGMRDLSALGRLAGAARAAGATGLHVRADITNGASDAPALLDASPDILSVEMHADSASAYEAITGVDGFAGALAGLEALANASTPVAWARLPWIVPRMTKRDATHDEIESFVDKWTLVFGHAAIDPMPHPAPDERVRPLPLPASAAARFTRTDRAVDLRGRSPQ